MKHKKFIKILLIIIVIIVLCVSALVIYSANYYHSQTNNLVSSDAISVTVLDDMIIFEPKTPSVGLIFYPGGKVEFTAYTDLMQTFAENNILCVLVRMPFNLAVFDMNAADDAISLFPEIDSWYIGGHSLGGAIAASYAEKNTDSLAGLLLLGAYSTADLSQSGLTVISVYGSDDEVMNKDNYEKYIENMPKNFIEHVIDGGCHSYFGNYGLQKGDGTPTITREEQLEDTVSVFKTAIFKTDNAA